jgi:hypothetical protein
MDEPRSEAIAMIEEASAEYLGKWNRLVSTTNWEKGRIICQWREALQDAGAPPASFTDDSWSRQVGSVSPQHVGRLRRVYQQFGETRGQYSGLYWSHFQAALEWPDPELWLEGAAQNGWSVAEMRQQRAEATGMAPEAAAAAAAEAPLSEELDEDAPESENAGLATTIVPTTEAVRNPDDEEDNMNDDGEPRSQRSGVDDDEQESGFEEEPASAVRPFEGLAPLPPDLADAVERLKLAIVHHRIAGWQEVTCQHLLDALEALKQLALAPTESSAAPF